MLCYGNALFQRVLRITRANRKSSSGHTILPHHTIVIKLIRMLHSLYRGRFSYRAHISVKCYKTLRDTLSVLKNDDNATTEEVPELITLYMNEYCYCKPHDFHLHAKL